MSLVQLFRIFKTNKRGNVASIFALALLPIMLAIGAAVDYSLVTKMRGKISHSIDAALLAATAAVMEEVDLNDTAAVNARLTKEFEPFLLANIRNEPGFNYSGYRLVFDPDTKEVTAKIDMVYDTVLYKIVGLNTLEEEIVAKIKMTKEAGGAMSMYLVLDRSGSMNGGGNPSRMTSLKVAVASMVNDFKIADPDSEYIRMGMVSYARDTSPAPVPGWNLTQTNNAVQALRARGGTDSSGAVDKAYQLLKDPVEINQHAAKSGLDPALIMVFMTDGNNNRRRFDTETLITCTNAKNYGMEIYTVAFQAPSNGQALLSSCATDAAHYFEPENTAELIQAFKKIGASTSRKLHLSY